jgi:hypothetical protein
VTHTTSRRVFAGQLLTEERRQKPFFQRSLFPLSLLQPALPYTPPLPLLVHTHKRIRKRSSLQADGSSSHFDFSPRSPLTVTQGSVYALWTLSRTRSPSLQPSHSLPALYLLPLPLISLTGDLPRLDSASSPKTPRSISAASSTPFTPASASAPFPPFSNDFPPQARQLIFHLLTRLGERRRKSQRGLPLPHRARLECRVRRYFSRFLRRNRPRRKRFAGTLEAHSTAHQPGRRRRRQASIPHQVLRIACRSLWEPSEGRV